MASEDSSITHESLTEQVSIQEVPLCDDNIFADPNSIDYLVKCTKPKKNKTSVEGRRNSLFEKFDPLYTKTSEVNCTQQKSLEEFSESDIGYETGSSNSIFTVCEEYSTSSAGSVTSKCEMEKPAQVVNTVLSTEVTTAVSTFTASTPERLVCSFSAILTPTQGSTPSMACQHSPCHKNTQDDEFNNLQSLRVILQSQDQELSHLRDENKELNYSLQNTNKEIKRLEDNVQNLVQKEQKLQQQINDRAMNNKLMAMVMEDYEKKITLLIEEQEKEAAERDKALDYLNHMESSFNNLLQKYEKCKVVINKFNDRFKAMEKNISELEAGTKKYENLYNRLKKHTFDSLNKANETCDQLNKAQHLEIKKLNTKIKEYESEISSLQEILSEKIRESDQLTTMCDQLINNNN